MLRVYNGSKICAMHLSELLWLLLLLLLLQPAGGQTLDASGSNAAACWLRSILTTRAPQDVWLQHQQ
jgi:hypothetical protein